VRAPRLSRKRLLSLVFFALGAAFVTILMLRYGTRELLFAASKVGPGFVPYVASHGPTLLLDAIAWMALLPREGRPPLARVGLMRWIGESVNNLLSVARVAGDLVRGALVSKEGVRTSKAGAAVALDLGLGLVAELLFGALAVGLLSASGGEATRPVVALLVVALLIAGLVRAHRTGWIGRSLERLDRKEWSKKIRPILDWLKQIDRELHETTLAPKMILAAAGLRLAACATQALELWFGAHLLGLDVGIREAIILQALLNLIRAAAFAVPAGLGVQEGGFIVIGGLVHLPPTNALVLALIVRSKELVLALLGLLAWSGLARTRASPPVLNRGGLNSEEE
jgi:putative membrane protein